MREHPPGNEIIIIGVELILLTPVFVREVVGEGGVLQDMSAVGHRPSRQTRNAAVQMCRGRDLKVPPLEIDGAEERPDVRPLGAPQTLTGPHTANLRLLEGGQHPREDGWRPDHVVVRKNGDFRADFGDGTAHLAALVRARDAEGAQARRVNRLHQLG